MRLFPFLGNPDILGVDLGTFAVKVVQIKMTGSKAAPKYSLVRYGQATIPTEGAELSPQDWKTRAVEALKTILREQQFSVKKAATSVSGNAVIVRYVKFPRLAPAELEKTIAFEAEPYIPFNVAEVNIGFQILGDIMDEGQKKMETILVAAKKDIIQERVDILYEAGLRPAIVDVDAIALENAVDLGRNREQPDTVLCVNVGATTTNICVVEDGVSKVVRDVFIAGASFTRALQRNLQVDYKTAETLKQKYGIMVRGESGEVEQPYQGEEADKFVEVSTVLAPVVKELLTEIQRSVEYFLSQAGEHERRIDRILLSGGSARLRSLDKAFAKYLNVPVAVANPFQSLEVPPTLLATEADQAATPVFAVALGLASRREGDAPR
ncbi:MAG: type IV pilus assembly protein PilM [bacterium]